MKKIYYIIITIFLSCKQEEIEPFITPLENMPVDSTCNCCIVDHLNLSSDTSYIDSSGLNRNDVTLMGDTICIFLYSYDTTVMWDLTPEYHLKLIQYDSCVELVDYYFAIIEEHSTSGHVYEYTDDDFKLFSYEKGVDISFKLGFSDSTTTNTHQRDVFIIHEW